ncbi:DMT family transporter [Helicobacter sp. 23-1045]
MSGKTLGHALALGSVGIWSSLYVSVKILLEAFNPLELLFLQSILGYVFLWIMKPKCLKIPLKNELYFALCGLFGITIYNLFLNLAMERTLASNVSVIITTAPLFAGILSFCFKLEKPYLNFFAGFALSIIGVYLLSGDVKIHILGDILAIISAAGWGAYAVLVAKVMNLKYDIFLTTRRILFWGIVFIVPSFLFFDFAPNLNALKEPKIALNLFFVALFASALCFIMWNKATQLIGVVRTNIYVYLTPVFTIIASILILDERLGAVAFAGVVLVLFGVFISELRQKSRQKKSPKS